MKPSIASHYGGALLLAKRPQQALAEFQRVLARQPDSVEAMFGVANALAALGRTVEAVSQYQAVLRGHPTHAGAHFKAGNALLDLDQVPAAVEHYSAAVKLMPAMPRRITTSAWHMRVSNVGPRRALSSKRP